LTGKKKATNKTEATLRWAEAQADTMPRVTEVRIASHLSVAIEPMITKAPFAFQQSSPSQAAFLLLLTSETSFSGDNKQTSRLFKKNEISI